MKDSKEVAEQSKKIFSFLMKELGLNSHEAGAMLITTILQISAAHGMSQNEFNSMLEQAKRHYALILETCGKNERT